jgi:hypothetical protein
MYGWHRSLEDLLHAKCSTVYASAVIGVRWCLSHCHVDTVSVVAGAVVVLPQLTHLVSPFPNPEHVRRCCWMLQASSCGQMQRLLLGSTHLTSLLLTNCTRLAQVVVMNQAVAAAAAAAAADDNESQAAGERQISLRGCGALAAADRSALKRLVGTA